RFRKAHIYGQYGTRDGIEVVDLAGSDPHWDWYYFNSGDVVEFKHAGKIIQRKISIEYKTFNTSDQGRLVKCQANLAFVRVGRKKTRVIDAPPMRLVHSIYW